MSVKLTLLIITPGFERYVAEAMGYSSGDVSSVLTDLDGVLSDLIKPPSMRASMFVSSEGSNLSPGVPILELMIVYIIRLTLSVPVRILLGRSKDILHHQ